MEITREDARKIVLRVLASGGYAHPAESVLRSMEASLQELMRGMYVVPEFRGGTHVPQTARPAEAVDHPAHYGGADNPYEAIKVIDAWALGFALGNTVKYVARSGKKGNALEDLKKARWYLDHEIQRLEVP